MTLQFKQIPVFNDNYIWVLELNHRVWVVDPGKPEEVLSLLQRENYNLEGILVTHHHQDHIGGIEVLVNASTHPVHVIGPEFESIPCRTEVARDGDMFELFPQVQVEVLSMTGHTKGHIAYFLPVSKANSEPRLFCGDTLFSVGCGRVFEGTPAQMFESLQKIKNLPKETYICCAHEYTLSNIKFAKTIDGSNQDLLKWSVEAANLREQNLPTVPTTIDLEIRVNPFLRCDQKAISDVVNLATHKIASTPVEVFTAIRSWKDGFR